MPVVAVSRRAYEKGGVHAGGPAAGESGGTIGQHHTGGRAGGKDRPVETRRDTWNTLAAGTMRAACAAIVHGGFEVILPGFFAVSPPDQFKDRLFADLQQRAQEYYRGEVWPLRHAFGVLSCFINGAADAGGKLLTPMVVTTWVSAGGFISCSCLWRSHHIARLRACGRRRPRATAEVAATYGATPDCGEARRLVARVAITDADCAHARTISSTIQRLFRRLGVSVEIFRAVAATSFEQGDPGNVAAVRGAGGDLVTGEDWDAEGPLETVQTGQSVVGVVVSGLGICKVVAMNEPGDPRCFREAVNALGTTRYKDISSF